MKKFFVTVAIFALVLIGCGNDSTDNENGGNGGNNGNDSSGGTTTETTLTIKNVSDYDIWHVEYNSIDFGSIDHGSSKKMNVSEWTGYIYVTMYFGDEYGMMAMRTSEAITCEENVSSQSSISNNTIMVTLPPFNETGTFKNIVDTFVESSKHG